MVLGGPLSHMMAAKAVALAEARQDSFRTYAQDIADNAKSLADGFLSRGATLVTGGTDNHIVLLDVSSFGLTGRQAEFALLDAGVVTNRNSVPARPQRRLVHLRHPPGHPRAHHPRLRPRRVRQGRGADGPRPAEHPAGHDQGRRAVEGVLRPGEGVADKVKDASAEMLDKHPLYPGLELGLSQPIGAVLDLGPAASRRSAAAARPPVSARCSR